MCTFIPSTLTHQLKADAVTDHGEFVFVCSFMSEVYLVYSWYLIIGEQLKLKTDVGNIFAT